MSNIKTKERLDELRNSRSSIDDRVIPVHPVFQIQLGLPQLERIAGPGKKQLAAQHLSFLGVYVYRFESYRVHISE